MGDMGGWLKWWWRMMDMEVVEVQGGVRIQAVQELKYAPLSC
jgi:hypothetical protein